MSKITNKYNLSQQYLNDDKLATRAKLHQLYNVNQQSIDDWFFDNINLPKKTTILEVGCGNGNLWLNHLDKLSIDSELILTDFSSGMVDIVCKKFNKDLRVKTLFADVQNLPFKNNSFDIVIANHTLHHVENISKAISEVNRVLTPSGVFYATANGTNGLENYLHKTIQQLDSNNKAFSEPLSFNLQNANSYLKKYFSEFEIIEFPNALKVTNTHDLICWIETTRDMQTGITDELLKKLTIYFDSIIKVHGKIDIPKQVGVIVASKK